jgi:hypothetical protein
MALLENWFSLAPLYLEPITAVPGEPLMYFLVYPFASTEPVASHEIVEELADFFIMLR